MAGVKSRKCSYTTFQTFQGYFLYVNKMQNAPKKSFQCPHRFFTTLSKYKKIKLSLITSTIPNFLNSLIYWRNIEALNRVLFPKGFHLVHYKILIAVKSLMFLNYLKIMDWIFGVAVEGSEKWRIAKL